MSLQAGRTQNIVWVLIKCLCQQAETESSLESSLDSDQYFCKQVQTEFSPDSDQCLSMQAC